MIAQTYMSHKEMMNKNIDQLTKILKSNKIIVSDFPNYFLYGRLILNNLKEYTTEDNKVYYRHKVEIIDNLKSIRTYYNSVFDENNN